MTGPRTMIGGVLDLIYPRRCVFCEKFLSRDETDLCSACWQEIASTAQPKERKGEFFTRCVSVLPYEGKVRDSILRYKFQFHESNCVLYSTLIAAAIEQRYQGAYDLISWVPVSRRRKRQRGYDQAERIASVLGRKTRMPVQRTLKKIKNNKPQSGIADASQRIANVSGAYQAYHSSRYTGKRILLVDDVLTTGSTLNECARILRMAGAAEVLCVTLAATPKKR